MARTRTSVFELPVNQLSGYRRKPRMKKKEWQAKLLKMEKAMEAFPQEVRRQERAHREDLKVRKAFGKISLKIKKLISKRS